jgi:hypothetical protein
MTDWLQVRERLKFVAMQLDAGWEQTSLLGLWGDLEGLETAIEPYEDCQPVDAVDKLVRKMFLTK